MRSQASVPADFMPAGPAIFPPVQPVFDDQRRKPALPDRPSSRPASRPAEMSPGNRNITSQTTPLFAPWKTGPCRRPAELLASAGALHMISTSDNRPFSLFCNRGFRRNLVRHISTRAAPQNLKRVSLNAVQVYVRRNKGLISAPPYLTAGVGGCLISEIN